MSFKTAVRKTMIPVADIGLAPLVYPAGLMMKLIRRAGVANMPMCRRALLQVGVLPIRNEYYEPMFDPRNLVRSLRTERDLPAINWNLQEQLDILEAFHYADELRDIPSERTDASTFYLKDGENGWFDAGDAEYLYSIVRSKKPRRLVEIGSGMSTLIAAQAIKANRAEDASYSCEHICIEPYENEWLSTLDITLVRQRVEKSDRAIYESLGENDILFIDSSHVIRPQGDVVYEYLELLPMLAPGVMVHVHDIFTPCDYPSIWVEQEMRLWNEQYLVEAFLSYNQNWKVIGALNYLSHHNRELMQEKCPYLQPTSEPASFWMQRVA